MNVFAWHWAHPLYLAFLPVCLLPAGAVFWRARRSGLAFTRLPLLAALLRHPRQYARHSLVLLRALAAAGLLLALAAPWSLSPVPTVWSPDPDVCVVLDVSRSMRADDVSPNRLGAAKQFAAALAARHPGARFGLVVFAGTGQSRVPLTDDLDLFAAEVGGLEATDGPGEGTALGDALALGAERLRAAVNPAQAALPWQRLVLITDGANHAGRDPETVALHLARESIGLGVVGVGSEKTTVRREWDEVTQARRPLQDAYGRNQTWEPLDAAGLQRLAARAGGLFVRADDPRGAAALDPLFARAPGPAPVRTAPGPPRQWFWLPLAAALLALGSEFALAKTLFRPLQDA